MSSTSVPASGQKLVLVDIGHSFGKIAMVDLSGPGVRWDHLQSFPILRPGLVAEVSRHAEEVGFSVEHLFRSTPDLRVLASTSRLPGLQVMVAGLTNDEIKDALTFCSQMAIRVRGVVTRKRITWLDQTKGNDLAGIDAVLLVGGIERKKKRQLSELIQIMVRLLADVREQSPVFFLGCQEVLDDVQAGFEGKCQVFLVPQLWPGLNQKNFLPLYGHLQDLAARQSERDGYVSAFSRSNQIHMESGVSALLAALAVLTEQWHDSVVLIDIGSHQTTMCWSQYRDVFTFPPLPSWGEHSVVIKPDEATGQSETQFGVHVTPAGLGHDSQAILQSLKKETLAWPGQDRFSLSDRIFNQVLLYPGTLPDEADMLWQESLITSYLHRLWLTLPPNYAPRHVVLSGACFGGGQRSERLLENIMLASAIPFGAEIWVNRGPYLPLLGILSKELKDYSHFPWEERLIKIGDYVRIMGEGKKKKEKVRISIEQGEDTLDEVRLKGGEVRSIRTGADQKVLLRVTPASWARVVGYSKGEEVMVRTRQGSFGFLINAR